MENILPAPQPIGQPGRASQRLALLALVVLLAAVMWVVWQARRAGSTPPGEFPSNPALEERFGVRFTFLAVSAESGIIDLRYRVLDADKARSFGHYTETSPLLINEQTGKRLEVTHMGMHNHRVEPGRMYYILYRNTDFGVRPGDKVTLQIDNMKIEHIVAK